MQGIQFIGTQRSGSNLLRLMLNQLPEISAPHPPHLLKTFVPLLDRYDSFKLLASDVREWVRLNPVAWNSWNMDLDDLIKETKQNSLVGLFEAVYETMAMIDKARIWCCKSLANVSYVDDLESNGVHPFYIHLVRDGRDVACSFKKAIVGPKHLYHLAKKWSDEQELAIEVSEKYVDRYILVRYEDLIQEPVLQLKRICAAIGVEYNESALEYYRSEESEITANSGEMWKNVANPVIHNNTNKYLELLPPDDINLFNQLAKEQLLKFDYSVDPIDEPLDLSEIDIQQFSVENMYLMDQALLNASSIDRSMRKPQVDLLREIKSRKHPTTYGAD